MINKIKFWYWRKYKSIPHADEMLELYTKNFPESVEQKNKYLWAERTLDYLWTMNIKETADNHDVTRERIRQSVWKAYRIWKIENKDSK